jgi:hypothetical protein
VLLCRVQIVRALSGHRSLTKLHCTAPYALDVVRMLHANANHPLCDLAFLGDLSLAASDELAALITAQPKKVLPMLPLRT